MTNSMWRPDGSKHDDGKTLTEHKVGQLGGEERHLLTESELPAHNHGFSQLSKIRINDGTPIGGWEAVI